MAYQVAPRITTNKEFSEAFGRALHRPAVIPVPSFVLRFLLSEDRSVMLTQGQRVVPQVASEVYYTGLLVVTMISLASVFLLVTSTLHSTIFVVNLKFAVCSLS